MSRQVIDNKNIGILLREERLSKGLLLRQASAINDIDSALLSKIERGTRLPTREQILKFSKSYNIDSEQLLLLWLAEKIVPLLKDESNPTLVLKIAEKKIKSIINKKRLNKEASDQGYYP